MNLLHTLLAELDVRGEPLDTLRLVQGRLDESGLDDAGLAVEGSDQRVGESRTGYPGVSASARFYSTLLCSEWQ